MVKKKRRLLDYAGSWKMNEEEAEKIKKLIRISKNTQINEIKNTF